jgi:hypothetical protein
MYLNVEERVSFLQRQRGHGIRSSHRRHTIPASILSKNKFIIILFSEHPQITHDSLARVAFALHISKVQEIREAFPRQVRRRDNPLKKNVGVLVLVVFVVCSCDVITSRENI